MYVTIDICGQNNASWYIVLYLIRTKEIYELKLEFGKTLEINKQKKCVDQWKIGELFFIAENTRLVSQMFPSLDGWPLVNKKLLLY